MNRERNSFEGYSKELNSCQEIEIKLSKIDSMIFLLNYLFQYRYIDYIYFVLFRQKFVDFPIL